MNHIRQIKHTLFSCLFPVKSRCQWLKCFFIRDCLDWMTLYGSYKVLITSIGFLFTSYLKSFLTVIGHHLFNISYCCLEVFEWFALENKVKVAVAVCSNWNTQIFSLMSQNQRQRFAQADQLFCWYVRGILNLFSNNGLSIWCH